jgi:hypothetical protein
MKFRSNRPVLPVLVAELERLRLICLKTGADVERTTAQPNRLPRGEVYADAIQPEFPSFSRTTPAPLVQ